MMSRFRLRTYAYSAGVAMVALAVVLAAGCGGRRSEQAREQGDIHLRLGQFEQARQAYERALGIDSGNALASAGLGRVERTQGNHAAALTHFENALAADSSLLMAHVEKAYALDALGRADEALEAARAFAAVDAVQGLVLEANLLNRRNRSADARSLLDEAKGRMPDSETLRMALAFTLVQLGDFPAAEGELRSVLDEINADSTAARMGLVEVYRRQGRLPAVVEEMEGFVAARRAAFEAQPFERRVEMQYIGAQLQLALSLLELDRVDDAVAIAEPIVREHPDLPWANYVMGVCHLARDEVTDAIVALQAAATSLPDEPMVQEKLAIAQAGGLRRTARAPDSPAPARPAAVDAEALLPPPAAFDARPDAPAVAPAEMDWRTLWNTANLGRLLAGHEVFVSEGTAAREVVTLSALFTFNDALAAQVAAELPAGNPVRAFTDAMVARDVDTMRGVVDAWEESAPERRVLRENAHGFMLARIGMRGSALETLSSIGQAAPDNVVAFFNLANMYNGLGMGRLAALSLQRLLTRYPQALEARLLLFDTLERDDRREEARLLAETTHALYPEEPQVLLQLAEAYAALGNFELAGTVLRGGVQARPDDAGLRVGLALVSLRAGDLDDAAAQLGAIEAQAEALGAVSETRATLAALQGNWDAARTHLAAAPLDSLSAAGWALAISLAARSGEAPPEMPALEARDTARLAPVLAGIGRAPADSPADVLAFGERLAGDDEARAHFALGLAYLFQRLHGPAYDAFAAARTRLPGSPVLVRHLMTALERGVEVPDRAGKGRRMVEAEASLPAAWLGLAQVYAALDDPAAQASALESAFDLAPEDEGVLFARATQAEARGDAEKALDSYERLLAVGSESAAIFNNYAYYLLKTGGNADNALRYAERARDLLPGNPQVRHTLGLAQLRKGLLEDARTNLGAALEMMPSDPTLLLDYGQLLLEEGDTAQGRQSIELALRYADQLGIPFDRRAEAEALLSGT